MPLYEYRCDTCGSIFEIRQKFSDDPVTVHENCGGPVQRLLSAPAFQFKGTGWYITDYARGGKSEAGGSENKSGSENKGGADNKGGAEAKTESKGDAKSGSSSSSTPKSSSTTSSTASDK